MLSTNFFFIYISILTATTTSDYWRESMVMSIVCYYQTAKPGYLLLLFHVTFPKSNYIGTRRTHYTCSYYPP